MKLDPALGLLGVLMEPTTIVAKAWEQIDRIAQRATIAPQRVLVTGAGPIGLLAALLGSAARAEVHVLDRADGRARSPSSSATSAGTTSPAASATSTRRRT